MPLDFPNIPTPGQVWIASNGVAYVWDGSKWVVQAPAGTTGTVVNSFNTRAGNVTLLNSDVTTALGYTPSNAGHVKLINVLDYGATGNGTTDDTAAIKAAITALPSSGGVLLFPPGTYLITSQLQIPSNTLVQGPATLLAGSVFPMLTNLHASATTLTDTNIAIDAMTFDYGSSGAGGGYHCIDMIYVRNVRISNCVFQCRGAGNATGMIGCYNTVVQNCTAYGFSNCAYDHWQGPQNARVVSCYAESASSVQIVNFNPEPTSGSVTGYVADGFVLADCVLVGTGSSAIPIQAEPLGPSTAAQNIQITGNTFKNVNLVCRRATRSATIAGNTFYGLQGGVSVFASYAADGGTPDGIVFSNNTIVDPTTIGGNYAAVMVTGTNSAVIGNVFSGSNPYCASYTAAGVVLTGNSYPPTSYGALGTPNTLQVYAGSNYGTTTGSNTTDLSHGIMLYNPGYGFGVTPGRLNYVVGSGCAHEFVVNGTDILSVTAGGITAVGAGFVLNNTRQLFWQDANGNYPYEVVQSDNNHIFWGTNSTGGPRMIWSLYEHQDNSLFIFGPVVAFGQQIRFTGTASSVDSLGAHIDLTGAGTYGMNYYSNSTRIIAGSGGTIAFDVGGGQAGSFNASGQCLATGGFITATGGPTITSGTGAATGTQPAGSLFLRTDGAAGSRLYVSAGAGTWAAVAGV